MRARIYAAFSLALIVLLLLGIIAYPYAARAIIAGGLVGFGLLGVNFYLFNNLVVERRRAEVALRKSNENLNISVQALERTTDEIRLLGEMAGVLRSCVTFDEAAKTIARFTQELFPGDSGGLYIFNNTHDVLEVAALWGRVPPEERIFAPDDCWALRRGRMHLVEDLRSGVVCRHFSHASEDCYFCAPLMTQTDTVGVLHLTRSPHSTSRTAHAARGWTALKQSLALALAEQIALALANLKLRETIRVQQQASDPEEIRIPLTRPN
jgi:K+-sensing histidine kinase KdpD